MNERERLGKALKWHRNEVLGLYQFQLGQLLGYGEKTVKRAEAGRPTRPYLERWLKEFEPQEPELAAQVRQVLAALEADDGRRSRRAPQHPWVAWTPPAWGRLDPSDSSGSKDTPMKRRAFLAGSLALPAGAALEAGTTMVKDYEHIAQALRRAYSYTSPQTLMMRVSAELYALDEQLDHARGDTLPGLLRSHGEMHRVAGAVARWDLLDIPTAANHARLAAHAAYEAGDADLFSRVLILHAQICQKDGRINEATQAVDEACRLTPSNRPASVAFIHVIAAEMHARAGNEHAALTHLDFTHSATAKVKPDGVWRGSGAPTGARIVTYEAFTLQLLKRYDQAAELLDCALAEQGNDQRKYRATAAVNLAKTLYGKGEIEAAAERAGDAYQQALAVQYATTIRSVQELYLQLAPHHGLPAVRELGEQLRA